MLRCTLNHNTQFPGIIKRLAEYFDRINYHLIRSNSIIAYVVCSVVQSIQNSNSGYIFLFRSNFWRLFSNTERWLDKNTQFAFEWSSWKKAVFILHECQNYYHRYCIGPLSSMEYSLSCLSIIGTISIWTTCGTAQIMEITIKCCYYLLYLRFLACRHTLQSLLLGWVVSNPLWFEYFLYSRLIKF